MSLRGGYYTVIFMSCFTFILALSNLGTNFASAVLVKEDETQGYFRCHRYPELRGDIPGTGEDVETRNARHAMVVESLLADPFGEHAYHCLGKNRGAVVCMYCWQEVRQIYPVLYQCDEAS
jgi:hypothetical protein